MTLHIFSLIFIITSAWALNLTTTELGTLIGSTTKSTWTSKLIYQFLGVRYAKPPSGVNRFKPPVLAVPWEGVHDVSKPGRPCTVWAYIQNMTANELEADLEDCLHLSIYTKNISAQYPVMLFIHGGSFGERSAAQFPPNYLLEENIVLVVPQYRLGPFGFLSTLTEDIPGNAGLLDILLAINWTKELIHYFGGDSSRITIFGQSAGAAIASALLISPLSGKNLFQNVILQSGSIMANWATTITPVQKARKIAKLADCPSLNATESLNACFKNLDVISLLKAFVENDEMLQLTVGGTFNTVLPTSLNELLLNYDNNKKNVSLIAGVTKDEGSFILEGSYDTLQRLHGNNWNGQTMLKYIFENSGILDNVEYMVSFLENDYFTQKQLIENNFTDMIPSLTDLGGALNIKAPVLRFAQLHAQYYPHKTYLYSFDYSGDYTYFPYNRSASYPFNGGVHHSDENLYLFPNPEISPQLNINDTKIAQKMVTTWTSLAANSKPSTDDIIFWPPLTMYSGPVMHINTTDSISEDFVDEYFTSRKKSQQNGQIKNASNLIVVWYLIFLQCVYYFFGSFI